MVAVLRRCCIAQDRCLRDLWPAIDAFPLCIALAFPDFESMRAKYGEAIALAARK
jgi:hypothetical protein